MDYYQNVYECCAEGNNSLIWQMKNRIETCADLNIDDVGRKVILIGWIHSRHLSRFIKLKDGHGIIQCLIPSAVNILSIFYFVFKYFYNIFFLLS